MLVHPLPEFNVQVSMSSPKHEHDVAVSAVILRILHGAQSDSSTVVFGRHFVYNKFVVAWRHSGFARVYSLFGGVHLHARRSFAASCDVFIAETGRDHVRQFVVTHYHYKIAISPAICRLVTVDHCVVMLLTAMFSAYLHFCFRFDVFARINAMTVSTDQRRDSFNMLCSAFRRCLGFECKRVCI